MKRGYIHILDAADKLGTTAEGVRALVRSGRLTADGDEVAFAGVDRLVAQRAHSFGDLARAVRANTYGNGEPLKRLLNAGATTIATEDSAGFAVPSYTSDAIHDAFAGSAQSGGANIVALCKSLRTPSNSIIVPTNLQPAYAPGGVTAGYVGEAEEISQSKPKLTASGLKLAKIAGIVVVTEELLEDSPSLGAFLSTAARDALIWAASFEVLHGLGGGRVLGILNAPCTIVVAAESGPQAADTINATNIAKMHARMPAGSMPHAVWLVHPDARQQLDALPANVFTPGDALAPEGRLHGRPVISHEACEALGDLGDIIFADFSQYLVATKDPAVREATSVHFYFDQDLDAFKFTMRFQGQPAWGKSVASRVGGNIRSPFITLASR